MRTLTLVIQCHDRPPEWIYESHTRDIQRYQVVVKKISEGDVVKQRDEANEEIEKYIHGKWEDK